MPTLLVVVVLVPLVVHCAEAAPGRHTNRSGSSTAVAALFDMIYLPPTDKDVDYSGGGKARLFAGG
jgi:hypothetical protein